MDEVILAVRTHEAFHDEIMAAARRIDAGDMTPNTPQIIFHSIENLWRTMTPERWAMLRSLQESGAIQPDALPGLVGREAAPVAQDVENLKQLGLIETDEEGRVFVPWSKITAEVSIANAA
ncbi:hypothetical protein [Aurantimonas sp. VKM B-3413]|uniref:HVO_A0114 family putative DNA-binding protein n=1 Tax=Aurantimonas sp. VKM B-3413 TaxID=2779401 RepID=UPI001E387926|nr:hypothetical protein [Aurantimonas sp. VKM B-3413]MCB8838650.1 hypothetical protein [Aurantimonas sp. VKM B-3413]